MTGNRQTPDEKKICFIMCGDDGELAGESSRYIRQLEVPEGFSVEILSVDGAGGMAAGYNAAMGRTDARYKVYLRQGVLVIYRGFLVHVLNLFERHGEVGMLGVAGNRSLAWDGCPRSDGDWRRAGDYYADGPDGRERCFLSRAEGRYEGMLVLDGLLLATQYDLPWREDLFPGGDFYDSAQSLEFRKAGYETVLPRMDAPWCLYAGEPAEPADPGEYERQRGVFEAEYGALYREGTNGRRAVFQFFTGKESLLKTPYPPLVSEEDTDYIAFTTVKGAASSFWDVLYRREWTAAGVHERLGAYARCVETDENEVITGRLFPADPGSGTEDGGGKDAYPSRTRIPSFGEIPDVSFDPDRIVPTKKGGAYVFERNPVLRGGAYGGCPFLLTIGMPVSNQIGTIGRCLSHIRPLLDGLDAELVIVDTGSTDGTVDVCREYGAHVVGFPWCDNMSAARNQAIRHSKGLWYLSIDDDEWFEDVEDILRFFRSGAYREFNAATYIQRNYFYASGESYQDNHTIRMARRTPELHFEGRIHDMLMGMAKGGKTAQLLSVAHHYGFVHDDEGRVREKYVRNINILLQDVWEYPENIRFQYQLANELANVGNYRMAVPFFVRGISMQREGCGLEFWGRIHAVDLVNAERSVDTGNVLPAVALVRDMFDYTEAEQAYLAYASMEASLRLGRWEEVLTYDRQYREALAAYEKDPERSNAQTLTRLYVCNNDAYRMDGAVMPFCACVALRMREEAKKAAAEIEPGTVYAMKPYFAHYLFAAGQDVFEMHAGSLPEEWYGKYGVPMLDGCWEYVRSAADAPAGEQSAAVSRLNFLLGRFPVPHLQRCLFQAGDRMAGELPDYLLEWLLATPAETLGLRAACFYAGLLRKRLSDREGETPVFFAYVQLEGVFVERYYAEPEPGEDHAEEGGKIQRDSAAAYELYLGLRNTGNIRELTAHVETALKICPDFAVQVNYLLKRIFEQGCV